MYSKRFSSRVLGANIGPDLAPLTNTSKAFHPRDFASQPICCMKCVNLFKISGAIYILALRPSRLAQGAPILAP